MIQELNESIASRGYALVPLPLPPLIREKVLERNWDELDRCMQRETARDGLIFRELSRYSRFSAIEFIISIRSSLQEPDEDGIWHDDGSRILAFSLSLTLDPQALEGGRLGLRKRDAPDEDAELLETPPFGTMIVFATGHHGFEHRIHRVTRGERIIVAGWCT